MNKYLLACAGAFVLAMASCAQEDPVGGTPGAAGSSGGNPAGVAGTTGSGGDGTAGTSGAAGTGGTTGAGATGGTGGGAGGSNPGNAGAGNPGNAGAGGTNPGNAGAGGTNPGNAGAGGGNAGAIGNGGRGGATAGTTGAAGRGGTGGGAAGAGGGAAGRGGSGGAGGGAAGAGGSGSLDPSVITPGFDGYYWEATPSGNTALSGTNYPYGPPGGGCPTGTTWDTTGYINTRTATTVGGTNGQKYTININVRGVVGTRCYTGGTAATTAAGVGTGPNNTWYAGGRQSGDSIWNTMEIRVAPPIMPRLTGQSNAAYDIYFINSFNTTAWCQKEATYETRFNASFQVTGGATITLVNHDSNCRTLANCGSVEQQTSCNSSAARIIDMAGVTPPATAPGGGTFTQPRTGSLAGSTYYLQWVWFDVTSVTSP